MLSYREMTMDKTRCIYHSGCNGKVVAVVTKYYEIKFTCQKCDKSWIFGNGQSLWLPDFWDVKEKRNETHV